MSPNAIDYPRYAWQLANGSRIAGEKLMAARRQADLAAYLDTSQNMRILDLGNGHLRPQYALLRAAGHKVTGVDLVNCPQTTWRNVAYSVARRAYAIKLGLTTSSIDESMLVCADAVALPFMDNTFHLATSIAAFEHFLDVRGTVKELHRVILPGGLLWVCIHVFTSPSGGHNLSFTQVPLRKIPSDVDPWDHLRFRRLPIKVPLNEWRKHQYVDTIGVHFDILDDYCVTREGENFLTPKLLSELSEYTRDELTCATYIIVARKRLH